MAETWEDVRYWRQKAEEIRTNADGFRDPQRRWTMLAVADTYDRMANQLERWLRRQPEERKDAS